MIQKVKTLIKEILEKNVKGYILVSGVFLAGVILSFVLNISAGSEEEIKLYISDFVSNVKNYSIDSVKTFQLSMYGNIKLIALLLFMSLTVLGSAGTLACIFVKGFSYGAVFSALANMFGMKSILFFSCILLPHSLVSAPCFVSYALFCIKNSHTITTGMKNVRTSIIIPFVYALLCLAILCVSALVQAYIEPVFLRIIGF